MKIWSLYTPITAAKIKNIFEAFNDLILFCFVRRLVTPWAWTDGIKKPHTDAEWIWSSTGTAEIIKFCGRIHLKNIKNKL
jgi:hypothetical protein